MMMLTFPFTLSRFARITLATGIVGLACVPAAIAATAASARTALVIGNQSYTSLGALRTPRNDAKAMAAALQELGYETTLVLDATRQQMADATAALANRLAVPHQSVVFFYAGHAVQIRDANYLLPVDATVAMGTKPDDEFVSLSTLLKPVSSLDTDVIKLIFLDACRNNPFSQRLGRKGLAEIPFSPRNSMTVFATDPNNVADDGTWKYSPFTKAMLEEMGRVGQELDTAMTRVRNLVYLLTDEGQMPWVSKSLMDTFYFRKPVMAKLTLGHADDSAVVTLNNREVASSSGQATSEFSLYPGRNELAVMIYNQKTYTGNNPLWGRPEGWLYSLTLTLADGTIVSSALPPSNACGFGAQDRTLTLRAAEDAPPRNGRRHGGLFRATTAVLLLDEYSGQVRLADADCEAWAR